MDMITTLKELEIEYKLWNDGLGFHSLKELKAHTLPEIWEEFEEKKDLDDLMDENSEDTNEENGFYPSEIGED